MFLTPRKKYKYYRYIYNTKYKTNQNENLEHLLFCILSNMYVRYKEIQSSIPYKIQHSIGLFKNPIHYIVCTLLTKNLFVHNLCKNLLLSTYPIPLF